MKTPRPASTVIERTGLRGALNVTILAAVAVATPITGLLRQFPEFLVAHDLSYGDTFVLVVTLLFAPALPLVAWVGLARFGGRLERLLIALAVGAPVALLALQGAVKAEVGGWPAVALGAAAGILAASAYLRWRAARRFASLLGVVALVSPVMLLLSPEARRLSLSGGDEVVTGRAGSEASVVFVIFDELPMLSLLNAEGGIDSRNFPNFARLAATSHAFLNVESVSGATLVAVPAILRGEVPEKRQLPTYRDAPQSLFTLFAGDHEIWALEPVTELCPESLNLLSSQEPVDKWALTRSDLLVLFRRLSTPRPWADELPEVTSVWRNFAGDEVVAQSEEPKSELDINERYQQVRMGLEGGGDAERGGEFGRFLGSLRPGGRPTLHFIHSMLPHPPLVFTPTGKLYASGREARMAGQDKEWTDSNDLLVALAYQRHLLQAQYADRLLGALLDKLEATQRFSRSVVVVTADHGASYRPGESRRVPGPTNRAETLWVPLLIKGVDQREGLTHTMPLLTTDVLPTLFDVLGVPPPVPFEGSSALGEERGEKSAPLPDVTAARRWKAKLFGREADFQPPLRLGPDADLLGRQVDDLVVAEAQDLDLVRIRPGDTVDYDPRSRTVPLWITGVLRDHAGREDCCNLALAVNGRVAAVQRSYPAWEIDLVGFQILIAEGALEPGPNRLQPYLIEGTGASRRLLLPGTPRRRQRGQAK